VNLNADEMKPPDFYICTSEEAFDKTNQYETRGIVNITKNSSQIKSGAAATAKKTAVKKK